LAPAHLIEMSTSASSKMFMVEMNLIDEANQDHEKLWVAGVPNTLLALTEDQVATMQGKTKFDKSFLQLEAAQSVVGWNKVMKSNFNRSDSMQAKSPKNSRDGVLRHHTRGSGSYRFGLHDEKVHNTYNLPLEVDWRKRFSTSVRSQGHCGSCYAFAMSIMGEVRLRMQSNNKVKVHLSPQQMLSCSRTNQGCQGGYPYLLAKHAHEIGLVTEHDFPYSAMNAKCYSQRAGAQSVSPTVFRAADSYGYVGGFYGAGEEVAMMEELHKHGPIVAAIQAPRSIMYYRHGIFKATHFKEGGDVPQHEEGWMHTNHAVTIVGYGVDKKHNPPVKYWIVQNTWGPQWGEGGYFRIVRGVNNAAIETMPVQMRLNAVPADHSFIETQASELDRGCSFGGMCPGGPEVKHDEEEDTDEDNQE